MMTTNFIKSFEEIIGIEGGYVNDPKDKGGETKYGISKRSYPHLDIKNLTLNEAEYIYYNELPKRRFGDIHVHHGLSISATGSVRKDMEDMQVSLIRGHSHRIASHMVTYELRNNGEGETGPLVVVIAGYTL